MMFDVKLVLCLSPSAEPTDETQLTKDRDWRVPAGLRGPHVVRAAGGNDTHRSVSRDLARGTLQFGAPADGPPAAHHVTEHVPHLPHIQIVSDTTRLAASSGVLSYL